MDEKLSLFLSLSFSHYLYNKYVRLFLARLFQIWHRKKEFSPIVLRDLAKGEGLSRSIQDDRCARVARKGELPV